MKIVRCAICKNSEKIEELFEENLGKKIDDKTFSARRLPDKIHYKIVKCKKCTLIFSREIFPIEKINKLYSQSSFNYRKESKYLGRTYFDYLNKYIESLQNKKILDIGCGNGFFLLELIKNGAKDVWGVEPGEPMVKKTQALLKGRITVDILKSGLYKNNSFDIICCFHTLDHIVDPNEFLKIVFKLLKPGGKVFFVVHNTDGLSVKLFGERSPVFDVEHIYLFNKKTLAKIFTLNGFKKIFVFSHYNTYPLSYWMHLVPFSSRLKQNILKIFKKTGIGNIPIKINPGNIGIIAQK